MAEQTQDPMDFVRNMWGTMGIPIPGMVTPTFDTQDLGKRITDLKAVESWLRMNLSMLQMTIQNLEMQNSTLSTVQTISGLMSGSGNDAAGSAGDAPSVGDALQQAALWPWSLMQQMQAHLQKSVEEEAEPKAETKSAEKPRHAPKKAPAKKPG